MKILLSAYACNPEGGSELAVGMRALEAAASKHDVWVLTQPQMAQEVDAHLRAVGLSDRVTVVGVPPDVDATQGGMRGLVGEQRRHDRWQRNARRQALALHAAEDFDVVHHVTLAAYWMRVGVAAVPRPLVWGPVGGGVRAPFGLLPVLGIAGMTEDMVRAATQRLMAASFGARTAHGARVVFVQNRPTAARLDPSVRPTVLPNPLAAQVAVTLPAARTTDIVMVGRLIPWKAATLAVAVMPHVRHPDARLRIFGTGRQQTRVLRAIRRRGLEGRVTVEGVLPHAEVLARVAEAGALLHPALHEEGGFAVAEALSLGTPVVGLAHGGPAELVRVWPSSPATLVRPQRTGRTARALAAALDEHLASPAPIPAAPLEPARSFAEELLQAYENAAARAVEQHVADEGEVLS